MTYRHIQQPAEKQAALAEANENFEWRLSAKCRGMDPNLFFPERGTPIAEVRRAQAVCNLCDVKAECLDYALTVVERTGIYGGLTERERRAIRGKAYREQKGAA